MISWWLIHRRHWVALALLTLAAAALRFWHLDRPPLLIDECFTFWRTCGSYADLVETLRDDGFVPLHYELLWWIKQGFPIGPMRLVPGGLFQTPIVMRFVPAICGTLMVPVIYFTARQLFSRTVALLAALFVTCSAYAMFFSRDAKMYSPAWMLLTLASGCLMWWLRTGRTTAWLAWVAAGAAAAGVHVVTLLVVALAPLLFLTSRRVHWRRALLLLAGLALIGAGPAGYYLSFNRWAERSGGLVPGVTSEPAPDANWQASGLNWIGNSSDPAGEAFQSLSTYLCAYEWDGGNYRSAERLHRIAARTIIAMCGLLLLGALPWRRHWRAQAGPREPGWRAVLWLVCWIVVPAYCFFYCRSFDDAGSPRDWVMTVLGWGEGRWWWVAGAGLLLAVTGSLHRRAGLCIGAAVAVVAIAIVALFVTGLSSNVRMSPAIRNAALWTALAVVPAALWTHSGTTIRARTRALLPLVLVAAFLLLLCAGANSVWASLRAASLLRHPELPWRSIWHTRYIGIVWPAIWIAAAALVMRLPTRPLRIIAIVVIALPNLVNGVARHIAQTQVPYDRVFADVWSAKPSSDVRTYFNLNGRPFGQSGLPAGSYWKPIASYHLCLAGRFATNPTDFRTGKAWPFEYGPIVERFQSAVVYRPFTDAAQIASDLQSSPQVRRVIVWQEEAMFSTSFTDLTNRLGPQWRVVGDETISDFWYWSWSRRMTLNRFELHRVDSNADTK